MEDKWQCCWGQVRPKVSMWVRGERGNRSDEKQRSAPKSEWWRRRLWGCRQQRAHGGPGSMQWRREADEQADRRSRRQSPGLVARAQRAKSAWWLRELRPSGRAPKGRVGVAVPTSTIGCATYCRRSTYGAGGAVLHQEGGVFLSSSTNNRARPANGVRYMCSHAIRELMFIVHIAFAPIGCDSRMHVSACARFYLQPRHYVAHRRSLRMVSNTVTGAATLRIGGGDRCWRRRRQSTSQSVSYPDSFSGFCYRRCCSFCAVRLRRLELVSWLLAGSESKTRGGPRV